MRIPLHIPRDDKSPEADARRYELHSAMMRLNPKGFRTPPKNDQPVKRYADMLNNSLGN